MLEPERAELELVAGEGERRGAVAVAAVHRQRRQHRGAQAEDDLASLVAVARSIASNAFSSSAPRKIEMIAGGASLAPRRWSWPAFATDARSSAWCLFTAAMTAAQKNRNAHVLVRRVARLEQVRARVGAHRPVVVLARAVDAGERLLVQQAHEAVAARDVLQDLHRQLLVVGADVRVLEDRRELVLVRRDLVVAGLDRHAELGQLALGTRACRRGSARGSSRSSGRRARGPSAAWRRTACGPVLMRSGRS